MAFVPSADKTFDMEKYDWNVLTWKDKGYIKPITPTIAGEKKGNRPEIEFDDVNIKTGKLFDMPNGTGLGFVGLPVAQLGVGIIGNTDLQVRILPPLSISNYGKVFILGGGFKHDIKQWIPAVKHLPIVDIAVSVNYSIINSTFDSFQFFPDIDALGIDPTDGSRIDANLLIAAQDIGKTRQTEYYDKQELLFNMSAFRASLIASATVPFFTAYGSLGFSKSGTNIKMQGPYLLPVVELDGVTPVFALREENKINDPISLKMPRSSFFGGIGVRARFAILTIHGELTYQDYMLVNFGLGITLR